METSHAARAGARAWAVDDDKDWWTRRRQGRAAQGLARRHQGRGAQGRRKDATACRVTVQVPSVLPIPATSSGRCRSSRRSGRWPRNEAPARRERAVERRAPAHAAAAAARRPGPVAGPADPERGQRRRERRAHGQPRGRRRRRRARRRSSPSTATTSPSARAATRVRHPGAPAPRAGVGRRADHRARRLETSGSASRCTARPTCRTRSEMGLKDRFDGDRRGRDAATTARPPAARAAPHGIGYFKRKLLEEVDLAELVKLGPSQRRARLESLVADLLSREGPVLASAAAQRAHPPDRRRGPRPRRARAAAGRRVDHRDHGQRARRGLGRAQRQPAARSTRASPARPS